MTRQSRPRIPKAALRIFKSFRQEAKKTLADKKRPQALLLAVVKVAHEHKADLKKVSQELETLFAMIRAYHKGSYREVPLQTMVLVVLALMYVLSPIDAIPDFLPVVGYTDDVSVVLMVVRSIRGDLEQFRQWRQSRGEL